MNAQTNSLAADGHDDVWGKVIEAVEDDSTWEGHLDDFSISVCRKSIPITPVVKQKLVKESTPPGPVPRIDIEIATPTGNRSFVMSSVDISPLAMPVTGSPGKKKKAKRSSKQKKAQHESAPAPWDDIEQDFSTPLNDHAVPIEINVLPNDENDALPMHPHAQESSEDAFHRSFGDLNFSQEDAEKEDETNQLNASQHKFHKSMGDIPSQDLDDLMANPVDFLKSLEKKEPQHQSPKSKQDRTAANLKKMLHGQCGFPQGAIVTDKAERRSSKGRMDKRRYISSDKLRSRSVSVDARKKQGNQLNMRRHRSRSRGVSVDNRKETSSRRDRTIDKSQGKRKEKSSRDERTADKKTSRRKSPKSPSRRRSPSKRSSRSASDQNSSRDEGSSRKERTRERRLERSRSSKFTLDSNGKKVGRERSSSRQTRSISAMRANARNNGRSASPMLRGKSSSSNRRGSDKRTAPSRAKSEEILDLLATSTAGLDHLGLTSEELKTFGMLVGTDEKSPSKSPRRPLSRAKSMFVESSSVEDNSKNSHTSITRLNDSPKPPISPTKKCDDLKSLGETSRTASITQRTSSTSRGSLRSIPSIPSIDAGIQSSAEFATAPDSARSMLSGTSRESQEAADRLYREQAKLAREYRLAEEAKLKRLQEESRLLEEKTRAEEIRLKALQEEAKLLEARTKEEEARIAKEEEKRKRREEAARIAMEEEARRQQEELMIAAEEEQKKREQAALVTRKKELKKLEEARIAKEKAEKMREEARIAKEQAEKMQEAARVAEEEEKKNLELLRVKKDVEKRRQQKKEVEEQKKAECDKSLTRKIDAERAQSMNKIGAKSISTTDAIYKSLYDDETERKARRASSTIADKLSKFRNDNIQSLPPAFQVIHQQKKR